MTAQELRIGNWIQSGFYKDDPNKAIEIEIQSGDDIDYYAAKAESAGIPLTEEWLIKFGFETRSIKGYDNELKCWYIRSRRQDYFEIEIDDNDVFVYENGITTIIKFVHQLQNLYFALTGTELTIKE